jgi:hypothetical protein
MIELITFIAVFTGASVGIPVAAMAMVDAVIVRRAARTDA